MQADILPTCTALHRVVLRDSALTHCRACYTSSLFCFPAAAGWVARLRRLVELLAGCHMLTPAEQAALGRVQVQLEHLVSAMRTEWASVSGLVSLMCSLEGGAPPELTALHSAVSAHTAGRAWFGGSSSAVW